MFGDFKVGVSHNRPKCDIIKTKTGLGKRKRIYSRGGKTMTMYRIQFDNGVTVITPDWETVVQYVNGGDVETVTINGCGEILFDAQSVALRAPSA